MEQIPYEELHIMPLAKRHTLASLDSTNSDLNDFLKMMLYNIKKIWSAGLTYAAEKKIGHITKCIQD